MCHYGVKLSYPTLSLNVLDTPYIMHTSSSSHCISCLTRAPRGGLWYSPIMHYRLEGCWTYFLILDCSWLPGNLSWNCRRVNNSRPGSSMERGLASYWDNHLGSGHYVDGCRLCVVRHRRNSSRGWRLSITTFSLNKKIIILLRLHYAKYLNGNNN